MPVYRQKNREKNRCQLAHSGETDDAYAKCNPNMSFICSARTLNAQELRRSLRDILSFCALE